jgi:hypothetical protein
LKGAIEMLGPSLISDLASFGAAGLMGGMWLWERRNSRTREEQLTEAHGRIIRDEQRLSELVEVVEHNTAVMTRFAETQQFVRQAMADLKEEIRNGRKK